MTDASPFAKLVPGFDFLQGLVKNAGAALPGIGQWVAPTIDPAELDKRIEELRTVQYWLEQNARMLAATIQALEVQRMTLSTLKTMNVQMEGLRDSLKVHVPGVDTPAPPPAAADAAAPGAVDPMQWWGALTQQFTELATTAMKDTDAARAMAGDMVKQSFDTASANLRKATSAAAKPAPAAAPKKAPARSTARKPTAARPR